MFPLKRFRSLQKGCNEVYKDLKGSIAYEGTQSGLKNLNFNALEDFNGMIRLELKARCFLKGIQSY